MKNHKAYRHTVKRAARSAAAAAAAVILAFQPYSPSIIRAHADESVRDGSGFGDLADSRGSGKHKLLNVSQTYDDGTRYTSEYKYDEKGRLIHMNTRDTDGSRTTASLTYGSMASYTETRCHYDADSKSETSEISEYGDDGDLVHSIRTIKYADGSSESAEAWFADEYEPYAYVETAVDGTVTRTDYTYNDYGQKLTCSVAVSNGSLSSEEWRYDDQGENIYYKNYNYNSDLGTILTTEMCVLSEGKSKSVYAVETIGYGDGKIKKTETWMRSEDALPTKKVTTAADGSSITETYAYNSEGDETLYTRSTGGRITKRRETIYTKNGEKVIDTDESGVATTSITYDEQSEKITSEMTVEKKDGSSVYTKTVYSGSSSLMSDVRKEKASDNTETSSESIYNSDGSCIKTEHLADGTVTVTAIDAEGNEVSSHKTLPDGTTADTSFEKDAGGRVSSKTTLYADGSMDRSTYEYNEKGEITRETETRRNGVSAVSLHQMEEGNKRGTLSMTFSNGFQIICHLLEENGVRKSSTSYSAGDIAQNLLTYENGILTSETIYRDGRTENTSLNMQDDPNYAAALDLFKSHEKYFHDFTDLAWQYVPEQAAADTAAQP